MNLIDRQDIVIGAGLLALTAGIAALSVPWALIILGGVLLAMGVSGILRRGRL